MANFRMGYIGKSFTMGVLGIVGTLVACGGGGVTSSMATATVSPYVLFASQYSMIGGASSEPFARSQEGGSVFSFFDSVTGGFRYTWGLGENAEWLKQRQAYGVQATSTSAVTSANYFGLAVKAPANGSVNASNSDTLVVQMGNGSATDAFPNSHMKFTVTVSGGTQDNSYNWSRSCSYDQTLDADSRPGPSPTAATHPFGLRTYRIPLNSFTCSSGTMADLKADVKEIAVKVIGGKDAAASAVTSANNTLLQIGMIAFAAN